MHINFFCASIFFLNPKKFFLFKTCSVSRPALGGYPRTDFVQILKNSLGQVAPKGLRHVQAMLCGTSANENAIKTAFIHYQTRKRGGKLPSKEDMESCMDNEIPGSPNLCVLGIFLEFLEKLFLLIFRF